MPGRKKGVSNDLYYGKSRVFHLHNRMSSLIEGSGQGFLLDYLRHENFFEGYELFGTERDNELMIGLDPKLHLPPRNTID